MKLSEKGWDRLLYEALYWDEDIANEALEWSNIKQEYKLRHIEFEPDDFEGVVVLTLDEAKALLRRIPEFKKNGDWQLPIERLKERISKAEGK